MGSQEIDPIEKHHVEQMNAFADVLKELFPGFGFALFVFDFGDGGKFNYVSNSKREDMICMLKEFQAVLQGRKVEGPDQKQ